MCEVCKTDQKCAHPWAQCMASRGEHCAACGHTSWAPRRPPTLRHRPPVQKSPKGQPQEGGSSPSGVWPGTSHAPGDSFVAYIARLAPVVVVMAMATSAADGDRYDASLSSYRHT